MSEQSGCSCGGGGCTEGGADNRLEISPRDTKRMMDSGAEFLLLDCRKVEEWEQSRIEGAKLVPMDELSLHVEELREWEDREIVVYCRTGKRSLRVTNVLRAMGFGKVRSMAGGIFGWSDEVDPAVKKY